MSQSSTQPSCCWYESLILRKTTVVEKGPFACHTWPSRQVFIMSVWRGKATPGSQLLNLRYRNEWALRNDPTVGNMQSDFVNETLFILRLHVRPIETPGGWSDRGRGPLFEHPATSTLRRWLRRCAVRVGSPVQGSGSGRMDRTHKSEQLPSRLHKAACLGGAQGPRGHVQTLCIDKFAGLPSKRALQVDARLMVLSCFTLDQS